MLNNIKGVPESILLPIYMGGLRHALRNQVRFQHPQTVAAAMVYANEFESVGERASAPPRRQWQPRDNRSSVQLPSSTGPSDPSKSAPNAANNLRSRDLSKLPIV